MGFILKLKLSHLPDSFPLSLKATGPLPAAGAEGLLLDEALAGVALLDGVGQPRCVAVDLRVPAQQIFGKENIITEILH